MVFWLSTVGCVNPEPEPTPSPGAIESPEPYINRLIEETSPYLLQHAHNPVDWRPWGDDAFEAARQLNRPILLSIGYSTCHWCHVMEEESFNDLEIAQFMNEHYVAIKVDRETRPDVDAVYMAAVQEMTGQGGWPLTVWLTPEGKPFYGGTYMPARDGDRGVPAGFLTVLKRMERAWQQEGAKVTTVSEQLASRLQPVQNSSPSPIGTQVVQAALAAFKTSFDHDNGGIKQQPKFPASFPTRFHLRASKAFKDADALAMATRTLAAIQDGGIHDQIGGGFHRYTIDSRWLVPHFEKMLYDQAMLAMAYTEAWQLTADPTFRETTLSTLDFVLEEMTLPSGCFTSALDADSANESGEMEEGWFYTWTLDEVKATLGPNEVLQAQQRWGIDAQGEVDGRNVLHRTTKDPGNDLRQRLKTARADRPPPFRDDKCITAWNGLMISALAKGGMVLSTSRYLKAAVRGGQHIMDQAQTTKGLVRTVTRGVAEGTAFLDDYTYVIAAFLDLYEATGSVAWLEQAIALDNVVSSNFEDDGRFFYTPQTDLLFRTQPNRDGALPSPTSVHLLSLLRLAEITTNDQYRQRAQRGLEQAAPWMTETPLQAGELLLAATFFTQPRKQVVLVSKPGQTNPELLEILQTTYAPQAVRILATEGDQDHVQLVPQLKGRKAGTDSTAYVCEGWVCALPTSDPAVFKDLLNKPI